MLRCIHNLFHREGKVILLPEVDVEDTIFHLDVSLLEAFSPAIRILAGNVVLQVIPAAFGQVLVHDHGGTAAQFTIPFLDRKPDALDMGCQVGVVFRIHVLLNVGAFLGYLCSNCFHNLYRSTQPA